MEEMTTLSQAFACRFKIKPNSPKSYSITELIGRQIRIEVEPFVSEVGIVYQELEAYATISGFYHEITKQGNSLDQLFYGCSLQMQGCWVAGLQISQIWDQIEINNHTKIRESYFQSKWYLEYPSSDLYPCEIFLI